MKQIDWLFFDLGYTLVNEDLCHQKRIENAVKSLEASGIKVTEDEFYGRMVEASKRYESPFDTVRSQYGMAKMEAYPKQFEQLYSEVPKLLKKLHENYKIGIIANQSLGSEERLEKWGILEEIDCVIASAEAGIAKPDPEIFRFAFEKAKTKAENSVMIGDRLDNDIFPAKKLGMKTIWVRQGFGGMQEPKTSDYQPDLTIDTIEELIDIL